MKFLKNVRTELKKVKWPDRKYMLKYTIATMAFVLFFALYFYGINALVAFLKGLI